jgi:esterase/lipase
MYKLSFLADASGGGLLDNLLSNPTILVTVITFAATVLVKTGIKIYNMGRLSKAELVSRTEFAKFEARMRQDMKAYKDELFNSIWELCKTYMAAELKDVSDIKKISEEMKEMTIRYEEKMKNTVQLMDELKPAIKDIALLEKKVNRLEYGDVMTSSNRRTDND